MSGSTPPQQPPPVRIINGKKTFIPLENNPESLARLSSLLGIKDISFHDIYSLDPIIQDIPRPIHALIFIAPAPVYHRLWAKEHEERSIQTKTKSNGPEVTEDEAGIYSKVVLAGPDAPVMWFKQTIGHACGLMSLIHAVANRRVSNHIESTSPLRKILQDAVPLDIEPRAKLLYDSAELESCHMSAAAGGDTNPPDPTEPNGMHFITFVKNDGMFWELEGGNPMGPVDLGHLDDDEDVICEKAVKMGPGRYIEIGRELGIAEFSCVALAFES